MRRLIAFATVACVVAAGGFAVGRTTAGEEPGGYAAGLRAGRADGLREGRELQLAPDDRKAFDAGYTAGANDVFGGFDGGWDLSTPYVVRIARGTGPVTYRIDSREPFRDTPH
jgi:hypothetical protein